MTIAINQPLIERSQPYRGHWCAGKTGRPADSNKTHLSRNRQSVDVVDHTLSAFLASRKSRKDPEPVESDSGHAAKPPAVFECQRHHDTGLSSSLDSYSINIMGDTLHEQFIRKRRELSCVCQICNKAFARQSELRSHNIASHPSPTPLENNSISAEQRPATPQQYV